MMADQSGVLLVLASIVLLAFIGRLVWWAFRSSSVYKKAFAAWQGTASFAFLESNRHSMEALFANLKDSLQNVDGDVLELAIGSGGNLQFYPPGTSLIATDINPNVEERLLATLKQFPHVTLKKFLAGNVLDGVGVEDESVAAVVCTKFLCNLNDKEALKVLREVKRILKPVSSVLCIDPFQLVGMQLNWRTEQWVALCMIIDFIAAWRFYFVLSFSSEVLTSHLKGVYTYFVAFMLIHCTALPFPLISFSFPTCPAYRGFSTHGNIMQWSRTCNLILHCHSTPGWNIICWSPVQALKQGPCFD